MTSVETISSAKRLFAKQEHATSSNHQLHEGCLVISEAFQPKHPRPE